MDPIAQFKQAAKQMWSTFGSVETTTASVAPRLVAYAGVAAGSRVLDVACGTGVVALTAARLGAKTTGVDLTPELVARARENAAIMKLEVDFHEGDAEALPFPDAAFDVVVSQFGHMFAPRPEVATREMLRVLRPGGTIAVSTWAVEHFVGRLFLLIGRNSPPPPAGVSPPHLWGDEATVRQRLGDAVRDVAFARDAMFPYILSVPHFRIFLEDHIGPLTRLVAALEASDPGKLAAVRREIEETAAPYFENNRMRQDYLLTRATKV